MWLLFFTFENFVFLLLLIVMLWVSSLASGGRWPLESWPQSGFIFTLAEQWKSLSRFGSCPHDSHGFNWLGQMFLSSVSMGSFATSQGWVALCRRIRRCKAFPAWGHFKANNVRKRCGWQDAQLEGDNYCVSWTVKKNGPQSCQGVSWDLFLNCAKRRSDSSRRPSE